VDNDVISNMSRFLTNRCRQVYKLLGTKPLRDLIPFNLYPIPRIRIDRCSLFCSSGFFGRELAKFHQFVDVISRELAEVEDIIKGAGLSRSIDNITQFTLNPLNTNEFTDDACKLIRNNGVGSSHSREDIGNVIDRVELARDRAELAKLIDAFRPENEANCFEGTATNRLALSPLRPGCHVWGFDALPDEAGIVPDRFGGLDYFVGSFLAADAGR